MKHNCEKALPQSGYGAAIEYCYEDENKKFWVGNGEYGSQVNYCPFCGEKAPIQAKDTK
jgi:hypothetical protein